MAIAAASVQLTLENALKTFIAAQEIFPADFPIHAAHDPEKQPAEKSDYLAIIAKLPDWKTLRTNAIVPVEFQLITSVADSGTRSEKAGDHAERLGGIIQLFTDQNFVEALALLNAVTPALGFTGWEPAAESEDGQDKDAKALAPVLAYEFTVFLKEV